MLTMESTRTDQARAMRLVMAWIANDKPAVDHLIDEISQADDTSHATGAVLFCLVAYAAQMSVDHSPDPIRELERGIAQLLDLRSEGR